MQQLIRVLMILAVTSAGVLAASGAAAKGSTTSDKREVLAAVRGLIDGWRDADKAKATAVLDATFRLVTLRDGDDGPTVQIDTLEHLLSTMDQLTPGLWDDRLGTPKVKIDPTGIATVWTPYTFYLRGKLSHCGIETFQLYRKSDGWKIVNFADTHLWVSDGHDCPARTPTKSD